MVDMEQGSSYKSRGLTQLIRANTRIKVVIIIVLKPNSGVDPV